MNFTLTESVVAATTCTGELTVAPFVGEHMFTDGEVGPPLHGVGDGVGVGLGLGVGVGLGLGVGVGVGVGLGVGLGVGVGVGVGLGEGLAPLLTTMLSVCLKITPALSFACTVSRCVPAVMATCAVIALPLWVTLAEPST